MNIQINKGNKSGGAKPLRTPPPPPLVAQIEILRKDKMVKENKNAK
jgi:hypothetical protein